MFIDEKKAYVASAVTATGLVTVQVGMYMLKRKIPFNTCALVIGTGTGIVLLSVEMLRRACQLPSNRKSRRILPADEHQPNPDQALQDVPAENVVAGNVIQDVPIENEVAENVLQDVPVENAVL